MLKFFPNTNFKPCYILIEFNKQNLKSKIYNIGLLILVEMVILSTES